MCIRDRDVTNERQKVQITVTKTDSETKNALEGAVFGLFAKEDVYKRQGAVRQEVKDTKVEDDSFYLLTLAAVAKELKRRGLEEAKDVYKRQVEWDGVR